MCGGGGGGGDNMMQQMMMMQMMKPPAPPPPPPVLEQAAPLTNSKTKQAQQNDLSLGVAKYRNSGVNTGTASGSSTGLGISM